MFFPFGLIKQIIHSDLVNQTKLCNKFSHQWYHFLNPVENSAAYCLISSATHSGSRDSSVVILTEQSQLMSTRSGPPLEVGGGWVECHARPVLHATPPPPPPPAPKIHFQVKTKHLTETHLTSGAFNVMCEKSLWVLRTVFTDHWGNVHTDTSTFDTATGVSSACILQVAEVYLYCIFLYCVTPHLSQSLPPAIL